MSLKPIYPFEDGYFTTDDGLKLHYRTYHPSSGSQSAVPVICLPGLSRNVRDFDQLSEFLAHHATPKHNVISLDYRGRGLSDWDENKKNYNIVREAHDVLQLMAHLGLEKAAFIGTSRGGLILHIIATLKIEAMSALIFNDIGPEIELDGLLEIQNYLDENAPTLKSWQDVANSQKTIHGRDFPNLSDQDWMDMARDTHVDQNGQLIAEFDPKIVDSIKDLNQDTQLPTMWEQFELLKPIPIMTLRGANSRLFSDETLQKMDQTHPNHRAITVPNQGHPVLLHKDGIEHKILDFLTNANDIE